MDDTIVTETTLVLSESELALLRTALGLLSPIGFGGTLA